MIRACLVASLLVGCGCTGAPPCGGVLPGRRALVVVNEERSGPPALSLVDASDAGEGCRVDLDVAVDITTTAAWRPDGLAAAAIGDQSLSIFDLRGATPVARSVAATGTSIQYTGSGRWLVWRHWSGVFPSTLGPTTLQAVEADDPAAAPVELGTLDPNVGPPASSPIPAPTGDRVAVLGTDDVRVFDLGASGGPSTQDWTFTGAGVPEHASWSGDGRWLEVEFRQNGASAWIIDTPDPTKAPRSIGTFEDWAPDRERFLAFIGLGSTVFDLSSGTITAGAAASGVFDARWIDASQFAAQAPEYVPGQPATIYVADVGTGTARALATGVTSWVPMHTRSAILATHTDGSTWEIPTDGTPPLSLGCDQASPDEALVACVAMDGLDLYDTTDGHKRTIDLAPYGANAPRDGGVDWSPDSKRAWTTSFLLDPSVPSLALLRDPPYSALPLALWQPLAP